MFVVVIIVYVVFYVVGKVCVVGLLFVVDVVVIFGLGIDIFDYQVDWCVGCDWVVGVVIFEYVGQDVDLVWFLVWGYMLVGVWVMQVQLGLKVSSIQWNFCWIVIYDCFDCWIVIFFLGCDLEYMIKCVVRYDLFVVCVRLVMGVLIVMLWIVNFGFSV